jgi:hypothetical protein
METFVVQKSAIPPSRLSFSFLSKVGWELVAKDALANTHLDLHRLVFCQTLSRWSNGCQALRQGRTSARNGFDYSQLAKINFMLCCRLLSRS